MSNRICTGCGAHIVTTRAWDSADTATRAAWRAEGKRRHGSGNTCNRCYAREYTRPDTSPVPVWPAPGPWINDAACATVGGDGWYPTDEGDKAPAVRICQACPVRQACLDYALDNETDYVAWGIWGGLTPAQRRRARHERESAA